MATQETLRDFGKVLVPNSLILFRQMIVFGTGRQTLQSGNRGFSPSMLKSIRRHGVNNKVTIVFQYLNCEEASTTEQLLVKLKKFLTIVKDDVRESGFRYFGLQEASGELGITLENAEELFSSICEYVERTSKEPKENPLRLLASDWIRDWRKFFVSVREDQMNGTQSAVRISFEHCRMTSRGHRITLESSSSLT